jgi:hypothetical protein
MLDPEEDPAHVDGKYDVELLRCCFSNTDLGEPEPALLTKQSRRPNRLTA